MGIKVGLARFMEQPRVVEVEKGSCLSSLQGLVGGRIEAFDVLFGDMSCLFVNDEGAISGVVVVREIREKAQASS